MLQNHVLLSMPLEYTHLGKEFQIWGNGTQYTTYTNELLNSTDEGDNPSFVVHLLSHLGNEEVFIKLKQATIRLFTDEEGFVRAELHGLSPYTKFPFRDGKEMVELVRDKISAIFGDKGKRLDSKAQLCIDNFTVALSIPDSEAYWERLAQAVESFAAIGYAVDKTEDEALTDNASQALANLAEDLRTNLDKHQAAGSTKFQILEASKYGKFPKYVKEMFAKLHDSFRANML